MGPTEDQKYKTGWEPTPRGDLPGWSAPGLDTVKFPCSCSVKLVGLSMVLPGEISQMLIFVDQLPGPKCFQLVEILKQLVFLLIQTTTTFEPLLHIPTFPANWETWFLLILILIAMKAGLI